MSTLFSVMKNHVSKRAQLIKNPALRNIASVCAAPIMFVKDYTEIKYELKDQRALFYVEIFLTPNCSLRCKYCAACMPSYTEKYEIPFETIEASIRSFMDHVDFIENVRLLGGEPFVYTRLADTVKLLLTYGDKIGHIRIVTNATVVPQKQEVIDAIDNKKVVLDISNYGEVSTKKQELLDLAKKHRFSVKLGPQLMWSEPDFNYTKRGMTEDQLAHKFKKCGDYCRLIRDGKLFYCGSSFWTLFCEGADVKGDYVDLLNNEHPETLHDQIVDLYFNKKYLNGCDYCPGSYMHRPLVTPAGKEQLPLGVPQELEMPPGFEEVQRRRI